MRNLHASILMLALLTLAAIAPATTARAQSSPDPAKHPGVWQDIMTAPAPSGPYGTGYTTTERIVSRCTALEWAIRTSKDGNIRWYRRNYQTGYCLGFINATMAFFNFHNEAGKHTLGVCMPEEMQSLDVIRTFLDYVHAHPADTQYNPALLVYWSLLEKYPCKS